MRQDAAEEGPGGDRGDDPQNVYYCSMETSAGIVSLFLKTKDSQVESLYLVSDCLSRLLCLEDAAKGTPYENLELLLKSFNLNLKAVEKCTILPLKSRTWHFESFEIVFTGMGAQFVGLVSFPKKRAQFIAVCSRSKWSRHLTKSPFLALLVMAGSNAACKISSACSHAVSRRKLRRN
jgi:hypothetical protein